MRQFVRRLTNGGFADELPACKHILPLWQRRRQRHLWKFFQKLVICNALHKASFKYCKIYYASSGIAVHDRSFVLHKHILWLLLCTIYRHNPRQYTPSAGHRSPLRKKELEPQFPPGSTADQELTNSYFCFYIVYCVIVNKRLIPKICIMLFGLIMQTIKNIHIIQNFTMKKYIIWSLAINNTHNFSYLCLILGKLHKNS